MQLQILTMTGYGASGPVIASNHGDCEMLIFSGQINSLPLVLNTPPLPSRCSSAPAPAPPPSRDPPGQPRRPGAQVGPYINNQTDESRNEQRRNSCLLDCGPPWCIMLAWLAMNTTP